MLRRVFLWSVAICLIVVMIGTNDSFATVNDRSELGIEPGNEQGIHALNGEWEFYWNQLLEPADFTRDSTLVERADRIAVSSAWNGFQLESSQGIDDQGLPAFGYATYRKVLQFDSVEVGRDQAIYFRYINSATRVWVDGQLVEQAGKVGRTESEEVPRLRMVVGTFSPKSTQVEVVVHVSNYSFRDGGITGEVLYGNSRAIASYLFRNVIIQDLIFIGVFLMLAIYQLTLYMSRRKDRANAWLGLISLFTAIRTIGLNEFLSYELFPDLSWAVLIRAEYVAELLGFLCFILLIRELYPNEVRKFPFVASLVVILGWLVYLLTASTAQITATLLIEWGFFCLMLLYFSGYVSILALVRKREGTWINVAGLIIFMLAIVNDALFYTGNLETFSVLGYALLLYFVLTAVIIGLRHGRVAEQNLQLTEELREMNQALEGKVAARTEQVADLYRQRAALMSNIAHDLGSPLSGMKVHMELFSEQESSDSKRKAIFEMLAEKMNYMLDLVDNLFELSRLDSEQKSLAKERMSVAEWWSKVDSILNEKATLQPILFRKRTVHFSDAQAQATIELDLARIRRVVHNYLDNAIKFRTQPLAQVEVTVSVVPREVGIGEWVVFEVKDFGAGIHPNELPHLFDRFYQGQHFQQGSGLGLAIVQEIVTLHQGDVGAESVHGESSTFWFRLPLKFG